VKSGDVLKIGDTIGFVDTEGAPPPPTAPKKEAPKPPPAAPPAPATPPPPPVEGARMTKDAFVAGLKPQEALKSAPPPPSPTTPAPVSDKRETRTRMSTLRKVIASRLVEAQHTAAMLTTFNEIDMSQVMSLREKYKESFQKKHGVRLGLMSFFVKACVDALQAVPQVNSYIDGDDLVHREYFDIGIAVSTAKGVVVPVVRNCDQLDYAEIEKQIETFAKKAREGTLSLEDLRGGGFTITNGGVFGSLFSTPILFPPQSGILGMHKIDKRAVVVNDEIVIRPMMFVALSYDHRVIDGQEAVTFLVKIKNNLEDPCRHILNV
jgi:2-oxoglutarate dehydrogenase E2 component (dihydrolipoamide succinyltransferase)